MKFVLGIATILSLSVVSLLSAQDRLAANALKSAKAATALVELPSGKGYGSAFCINKKGYFITNQHVAEGARQADLITLILSPNQENQTIVKAKVLRMDESTDLALLKTETEVSIPALVLGQDDNLEETAQVTALGFPFGKALAGEEGTYPAVSVNVGRITSLRQKKGILNRIQVDAALNPGNSGGPVLDSKGEVIGVVVAGIFGTGVNFIIPVSHVARFVAKPKITFTPPKLAAGKLHLPVEFTASAVGPADFGQKYDLDLVLTIGKLTQRQVKMEPIGDGIYRCKTVLVPSTTGERPLRIEAAFPSDLIKCQVLDRPITVGEVKMKLSEVQTLDLGATPGATTVSGTNLLGKIGGLNAIQCTIGKQSVSLDLAQATVVQVEDLFAVSDIGYSIVAKKGEQVLETEEGVLIVEGGADKTPAALRKGLVLSYAFDKDEGDKVTDRSSKTNNGTLKGAKWTSSGKKGGAVEFSGNNDYLDAGKAISLNPRTGLTLSAWIKMRADGKSPTGYQAILARWDTVGGINERAYVLEVSLDRLIPRFGVSQNGTASGETFATSDTPIEANKWHHLCATWNGAILTIYVDGTAHGEVPCHAMASSPGNRTGIGAVIGRPDDGTVSPFAGFLDEVSIWDRALSPTEIRHLFNAAK